MKLRDSLTAAIVVAICLIWVIVDQRAAMQGINSALRLMPPLLLACLAGLYSERAGIFDIGLEGKMLMAAFTAGAIAFVTGNAWIGLLAGIGGAMVLSMIHGLASITFRGNQLISGVAINFLAAGLTVLLGQYAFQLGGRTPPLTGSGRFQSITLPFADALRDVPLIGPLYSQLLSGHSILVYIALLAVPVTWWVLFRTRFGLRLRAVGENPASVDTAGISVTRLRYTAVAICGLLTGIAGAYLATALSAGFVKDMTAGRGFIALAALIFARWHPWQALFATFLFALLEAVASLYPNAPLFVDLIQRVYPVPPGGSLPSWLAALPSALMNLLPYLLTVIILAGAVGRAIPPRAGGEPYVKER